MYFDKKLCLLGIKADSRDDLFEQMSSLLLKEGFVKDTYLEALKIRESEYPTGLLVGDTGFAIPHCDSRNVQKSQLCFGQLEHPIEFSDMVDKDHKIQVSLVFMLAMSQPHEQMETLGNLVALFQNKDVVNSLKKCKDERECAQILEDAGIR